MKICNETGEGVIVPANTLTVAILAITENGLVSVMIEPKMPTLEIDDDEVSIICNTVPSYYEN